MRVKPYEKKPIAHSPKGEVILSNAQKYLIRTPKGEAYTPDPGQAIAALIVSRRAKLRCLIYAVAPVLGEDALELVDEEFLMEQMEKR